MLSAYDLKKAYNSDTQIQDFKAGNMALSSLLPSTKHREQSALISSHRAKLTPLNVESLPYINSNKTLLKCGTLVETLSIGYIYTLNRHVPLSSRLKINVN